MKVIKDSQQGIVLGSSMWERIFGIFFLIPGLIFFLAIVSRIYYEGLGTLIEPAFIVWLAFSLFILIPGLHLTVHNVRVELDFVRWELGVHTVSIFGNDDKVIPFSSISVLLVRPIRQVGRGAVGQIEYFLYLNEEVEENYLYKEDDSDMVQLVIDRAAKENAFRVSLLSREWGGRL